MTRLAQKHEGTRPTLGGRRAPSRGEGRARPGVATPDQANEPRFADTQPTARMD